MATRRKTWRVGANSRCGCLGNHMPTVIRTGTLALAAAAAWASSASPAQAQPGTYTVSSCRLEDRPAPQAAWQLVDTSAATLGGASIFDRCDVGQGFGITSDSPIPGGAGASWRFVAPAGTTVEGVRLWRVVDAGQTNLAATDLYRLIAFGPAADLEIADQRTPQLGAPVYGPGSAFERHGLAAKGLEASLGCPFDADDPHKCYSYSETV